MTLLETIKVAQPHELLYIGSKSAFVFVVNRVEFNYIVPNEWKLREVKEVYGRVSGGWAFICEGLENGRIWTREEFLEMKEANYDKGNDWRVFCASDGRGIRNRGA